MGTTCEMDGNVLGEGNVGGELSGREWKIVKGEISGVGGNA